MDGSSLADGNSRERIFEAIILVKAYSVLSKVGEARCLAGEWKEYREGR